jgi:hypothetical protein
VGTVINANVFVVAGYSIAISRRICVLYRLVLAWRLDHNHGTSKAHVTVEAAEAEDDKQRVCLKGVPLAKTIPLVPLTLTNTL